MWAWVKEGTAQRGEVTGNPWPSKKTTVQSAQGPGHLALRLEPAPQEGLGDVREQGWVYDDGNKGPMFL